MTTTKQRRVILNIDVTPDERNRIQIAAEKSGLSVRDYVRESVEARLRHDLACEQSAADLLALNRQTDPVLAELWDNPRDAAYDKYPLTRCL